MVDPERVHDAPLDALAQWAASGGMALTGRRNGPPLASPGDPAGLVVEALDRVANLAAARGHRPQLPGPELLGERAALAGLRRRAPWSCGGAFTFLRTSDGHLGLTLARADDVALVPALVGRDLAAGEDPWAVVRAWATTTPTEQAVDRARLLGLPCAAAPAAGAPDRVDGPCMADASVATGELRLHEGARVVRRGTGRALPEVPLVLDFTALWAGPLCAHLLGLSGARVVKVESRFRLDGSRRGPVAFYDLLHAGHDAVWVDPTSDRERAALLDLVLRSDLVLEASRPRALRGWGLVAEDVVDHGTSWVSITARGRGSDSVGFGDDVAADGGLIAWENGEPLPCGDALADPLAGVVAAVAASEVLALDSAVMVDVAMRDVARAAARRPGPVPHRSVLVGGRWFALTDDGRQVEVLAPRGRRASGRAATAGRHSGSYLS